jgi:uncharacterized membrane protein YecN with MAPEG domain
MRSTGATRDDTKADPRTSSANCGVRVPTPMVLVAIVEMLSAEVWRVLVWRVLVARRAAEIVDPARVE